MATIKPLQSQLDVCERLGVKPCTLLSQDKIGLAISTMNTSPINGIRVPAMSGTSGWYIFGGEEASADPSFYSPICITHLRKYCEIAIPYLCLPPGWRFQIDSQGYEDVWYDETLGGGKADR